MAGGCHNAAAFFMHCSYTKYSGPVCTLELMVKLCGLHRYSYNVRSHHITGIVLRCFFPVFTNNFLDETVTLTLHVFFSFYIFFSGPAIGTSASLAVQI